MMFKYIAGSTGDVKGNIMFRCGTSAFEFLIIDTHITKYI